MTTTDQTPPPIRVLSVSLESSDPGAPRPWPLILTETGDIVSGRPDAIHVMAFRSGEWDMIVPSVDLDPATLTGTRPGFTSGMGNPWEVRDVTVQSAEWREYSEANLNILRTREAEYRKALARSKG